VEKAGGRQTPSRACLRKRTKRTAEEKSVTMEVAALGKSSDETLEKPSLELKLWKCQLGSLHHLFAGSLKAARCQRHHR